MTLAVGLVVSRLLHYLAVSILFGAALFPRYATGSAAAFGWLPRVLRTAALWAIAGNILWLMFAAASATGSLAGGLELSALLAILAQTNFGHIWTIRLVLAVALAAVLFLKPSSAGRNSVLVISAILLASLAATGRADTDTSNAASVHIVLDAVHLLAASLWIGALVAFVAMLGRARQTRLTSDIALVAGALSRFSQMGTGVVAVLLSSGLLNPNILVSFGTAFGQILLAKLFLFAGMLVCAAANRFWLTPKLESALVSHGSPGVALRALYITVLAETALAVLIFLAVAWLGILSPGGV